MRLLDKNRIGFDAARILSAVLPVIIVLCAFFIAQTEPGSILPVEATLRKLPMDQDLMIQVEDAVEDASYIRDALSSEDPILNRTAMRMLFTEYLDPFFMLALVLKAGAAEILLYMAYFVRFGLAGLCAYSMLRRSAGCKSIHALMFSVFYSVSATAVIAAGTISGMNFFILLPVMFGLMDESSRKGGFIVRVKAALMCFAVFATGIPGMLQGTIVSIIFAVFISIARHKRPVRAVRSLIILLWTIATGLLLSGIIRLPSLPAEENLGEGSIKFKFFDMIASFGSGMAVNATGKNVPALYCGIVTILLVIIFMIDRRVPVRMKVTFAVITVLFYVSTAYSTARSLLAYICDTGVYDSYRLAGLIVLIIFVAALSIKDVERADKKVIYGAGFIMTSVVLIANHAKDFYGYYNYQLFMTVISAVAGTVFLISSRNGSSRKRDTAFMIIAGIAVLSNLSYVFMMSNVDRSDFVIMKYAAEDDGIAIDTSIDIPIFGDSSSYIVLPGEFSGYEEGKDIGSAVNDMAEAVSGNRVFLDADMSELLNAGFIDLGDHKYVIPEDDCEIVFGIDDFLSGPVFVSSGFNYPLRVAVLDFYDDDEMAQRVSYEGPFLWETSYPDVSFDVSFWGNTSNGYVGKLGVYSLDQDALDELNRHIGKLSYRGFTIPEEFLTGGTSVKVMVTGMPYEESTKIRIGGVKANTFDYYGRLAATFTANTGNSSVMIEQSNESQLWGAASFLCGTLSIAACFVVDYLYKKRKRKGEMANA